MGNPAVMNGPIKTKGPLFDITAYGADGSGTTTTVSSWSDATHPVVASAASFSVGQYIGIDRAAATETTGNTSAGSGTISSVASTNTFAVNDYIRVVGGRAAQALQRCIVVKVGGNAGDVVTARINGTNYTYTLVGGETNALVATNLAAVITGDASIDVTVATNFVIITAHTAGTPFTYENVRPWAKDPTENVRTKLIYYTSAANIPTTDFVTKISAVGAASFTVSPVVPSALTGTRIEHYANRLVTKILGIASTTLAIEDAATTQPTGVAVYHDSGAALDAAVAAAAGNGTVFAPAGTFYLSNLGSAHTMDNASVVGAGKGQTVFRAPGYMLTAKLRWKTAANGASNIVLRDFTFDQQGNPYMGSTSGGAIQMGTYTATGTNSNIILDSVEVLNSPGYGVVIFNGQDVTVQGCHVKYTGNEGIHFGLYDNLSSHTDTTAGNIWIVGNLVEEVGWIGVSTYGDSSTAGSYTVGRYFGVHVNGNTFRHCALLGFEAYTGAIGVEVIGNTVEYSGGWESMWSNGSVNDHGGLTIKYAQEAIVQGNSIRNCHRGIEVFGRTNDATLGYFLTKDVKVSGNTISDCYQGVNNSNGSDAVDISDNVIDTVQNIGITSGGDDTRHWPCTNIKIHGNVVRNALQGIAVNPDSWSVDIRDNLIDSCNTFEENAASRTAIALNASGTGTWVATNIFLVGNKMRESRVGPTYGQQNALYADYAKGITLINNQAVGNASDTYSLTANATLSLSALNTWDGVAAKAGLVEIYTTPGSFTWTNRTGATIATILAIGGGGGGGGGGKGATNAVMCGGGGGGSSGHTILPLQCSLLGATVSGVVGAGGLGGAAQTVNSQNGTNGANGISSSFGTFVRSAGSGGGAGGTTSSGTAGSAGGGVIRNGSVGGAASTTGLIGNAGGAGLGYTGGGGGSGGGFTAAAVPSNGGAGGAGGSSMTTAPTAGTAGTAPGGNGGDGASVTANLVAGGAGGGGGASAISGNGGNGGNGGKYGAGGGGGGAGPNDTGNGGAGGNGADGIVIVITQF